MQIDYISSICRWAHNQKFLEANMNKKKGMIGQIPNFR